MQQMIKVQNGVATREAPPAWMPKNPELLRDTSWVTDAADKERLGGAVWWPEVDQTPELTATQTYGGTETLTVGDGVVNVVRGIRELTAEELRGPVPDRCTRRQGQLALLAHGVKPAQVQALIDAIEDDIERAAAQIEYEANDWDRDNRVVLQMWDTLGGTPEQLDDLYRLAVTL